MPYKNSLRREVAWVLGIRCISLFKVVVRILFNFGSYITMNDFKRIFLYITQDMEGRLDDIN